MVDTEKKKKKMLLYVGADEGSNVGKGVGVGVGNRVVGMFVGSWIIGEKLPVGHSNTVQDRDCIASFENST